MMRRTDIATLELSPRLDVAFLVAGGIQEAGPVTVKATPSPGGTALSWSRPGGGASGQRVSLTSYPLPLGGAAELILCSCGARVRSIFLAADHITWGCRACLGLRYRSQRVHYPARG